MRRHPTLGTEGRHQMRETDPKKIAHEHKDRQLMDRVAKAARHLVKWIHNEGLRARMYISRRSKRRSGSSISTGEPGRPKTET